MRRTHLFHTALFAAVTSSASAAPADASELPALREQLRALEQHILVLERKQELRDEAATASPAPRLQVSDRGFTLASADGANALRLRGLVQLDARQFFDDAAGLTRNTFVLRRARLSAEGVLARNFAFQFVTEFGGGSTSILDAALTATLSPQLQVKVGKFKSPVGLELLQSDAWTFFNERSLVTNLVPNRDLGLQLQGELLEGRLSYQAGVFNGVPDSGSSTNSDTDNGKDVVARVIAAPFKLADSPLQGLSVGLAGSFGREKHAAGRAASYRTDGQQTFFAYTSSTVADGQSWRVSPQLDFRHGPFGMIGEYVVSTVNVRSSANSPVTELRHRAWQASAGYVLTGENSAYTGVVPRTNFDPAAGTWGAFEVVARYAQLTIDDAAFPTFASPATNARAARSFGAGVNWYLTKTTLIKADYYHTAFDLHAIPAAPVLRQDEQAFITRFQLNF